MNASINIILGIATGIITAALIYVANQIFLKLVMPWYQNIKYKGVDLGGNWTGEMVDTTEISMPFTLNIKQKANKLKGFANLDKSKANDTYNITTYNIKGSVWEGYVTINYQSTDRTRLSFATSLLQVRMGGRKMEGIFVFRDVRHDEIRERRVIFKRLD